MLPGGTAASKSFRSPLALQVGAPRFPQSPGEPGGTEVQPFPPCTLPRGRTYQLPTCSYTQELGHLQRVNYIYLIAFIYRVCIDDMHTPFFPPLLQGLQKPDEEQVRKARSCPPPPPSPPQPRGSPPGLGLAPRLPLGVSQSPANAPAQPGEGSGVLPSWAVLIQN